MAKNDDLILDFDSDETDSDENEVLDNEKGKDRNKLDARRKLEEYMEMKRLRELIEF